MRILFIIIGLLLLTPKGFTQESHDTIINGNSENLKVMVLYFHITHRCNTCHSIEDNVRKTLNEHFQEAIDSGSVGLTILNCELPEHAAIVKKYSAYGATLAITAYEDGKEKTSEDLTNFAFQKTHNPELFNNELKEKISSLLK